MHGSGILHRTGKVYALAAAFPENIPVAAFLRKTEGLSEEAFVSRYPLGSLVIQVGADVVAASVYDTHPPRYVREDTVVSSDDGPAVTGSAESQFVHFLQKTGRNSFPNMVTLGRSHNNDLFIPHPSISKLHALLKESREGYTVTDVGSTNGSFLEGERLVENKAHALSSKASLRFGKVQATFFLPPDLFEFIDLFRRMQRF